MNHFAIPSASDGMLFLGAGQTIDAWTLGAGGAAPQAPQDVTASPASGQALVSWTAPVTAAGASITGYTVTPYQGSTAQPPVQVSDPTAASADVTGLTDGTSYTFTVTAKETTGTTRELARIRRGC